MKELPSIVVKNEYFPRSINAQHVKDGPLLRTLHFRAGKHLLRSSATLQGTNLQTNLTPENIAAGKFKVCLQYHIKKCKGPCEALQSLEEYNRNIAEITEILKGNISIIEKQIREEMQKLAVELRFEEAQELKEKLLLIQNFREKSQVVSNFGYNLDVFALEEDEQAAYINYLHG